MAAYKKLNQLDERFNLDIKGPNFHPRSTPRPTREDFSNSKIVDINKEGQLEQLLNDSDILVVKYYANWCGPCKNFAPKFEKLSEDYTGVTFAQEDIDKKLSKGINGVPTTRIYKGGNLVEEITGGNVEKVKNVISTVKSR
jgi:thioredoxin 1